MIEIRTLGRTSITVDDAELSGEAAWPKSLALVVYMAREPGPDRRDQVLGMLWPDREERRARHALNQLLYTLRKASPELDLESIEDALDFGREVWLDVEEFERRLEAGDLEGAVELYKGPFLVDVSVDVPDFEHWADRQRTQLARAFRRAALELAQKARESGDYETAMAHCRRLLGVDPLDDEVQHLFIECLYLSGERVAALRQFEKYRDLLALELDVEPLDATLELMERIRSESPEVLAGVSEEADRKEARREAPEARAPAGDAGEPHAPRVKAPRRRPDVRPWLAGALAALAVAASLAAVLLWPERPGVRMGVDGSAAVPLAARSLAVLPFSVQGPADGEEASGVAVAQLLTANLDGLGPIATVDHREVARSRQGSGLSRQAVGTPADLADWARSLGATALLAGTVHGDDGEIRLVADVFSAADGRRLARADVRGSPDSLLALTDRLTIQLAGALWAGAGVPAARMTATRSVAALKDYLRGREHLRRGEWTEAVALLRRAAEEDTGFLAARRALGDAIVLAELEPGAAYPEFVRASRLAAGTDVAARERAFEAARLEFILGEGRAAIMALEELAERWPDDREIGYKLGDAYFHYGWRLGFGLEATERRLTARVAGDSLFAPAIDHLWWTAMWRGDSATAARWAAAYGAAAPEGLWSDMAALAVEPGAGSLDGAKLGARDAGLAVLATSLALDSDPRRPRAIARAFADDPLSMANEEIGAELLALLALAGGRPDKADAWRDSARVLGLAASEARARRTLAALYGLSGPVPAAYPPPSLRAEDTRAEEPRRWIRDVWLHGAVAARNGDRSAASAAARALDDVPEDGLHATLGRSLAAAVRGELALEAGDSAAAYRELRAATATYTALAPLSRWETLPYYRLLLGQLEAGRGDHEAAVGILRTLFDRSLGDLLLRPRAALAMGRSLEALGDAGAAGRHYAAAARWWSEAEPAFASELEASQAGLARVGDAATM